MKSMILGLTIIGMLMGGSYIDNHYTRKDCKVVQINDGYATIVDQKGWAWDYDDKDLAVGDIVDLKMHNNNTDTIIEDDIIIKVVKK